MNDVDSWIYFEGPEPESIRPLLDALRELDAPRPTPEDKARAMASFFETFAARVARATEEEEEEARGEASSRAPILPPDGAGSVSSVSSVSSISSAEEDRARALREARLSFDDWAELSIRLIGASPEEKRQALSARMLSREWAGIDDGYLRLLSDDLRSGREDRPALYSARFLADMARRARVARAVERTEGVERAEKEDEVAPVRAVGRRANPLGGTAEAVVLPPEVREGMGKLPFLDPARSSAPEQEPPVTRRAPVTGSLGGTLPLADGVNFVKTITALPFAGSAVGDGVVTFPSLTVEQYVSLRFDLGTRPERSGETLRLYGVANEAAHRALDEHWQQQLAARPVLRADLDAAAARYMNWLKGVPR